MLLSILRKVSKLLLAYLLFANSVYAFDSSTAYNTITFSYIDNAYVKQTFVLSGTQQSTATSFKLTVDAKDGGGRPTHNLNGTCSTYCTQYDTAQIQIIAYNAGGGVISTKSVSQALKNWGSNAGWSAVPGDNQFDWSQMVTEITAADVGGSFASVARIEVRLVNQNEGSYWNGNYGVQFRTPTLQMNGSGSNLLYNSEFGIAPNSVRAQGWTVSYSSYNSCSGTASSQVCVTQESTVTANMWGGGYDANGGTTAGQPGGYESVLTSDNADTAAEGGDISSGSTPAAPTPVFSSGITNAQQTRKSNALNGILGHTAIVSVAGDDNDIYIQQAAGRHAVVVDVTGNTNTVNVLQTGQGYTGVQHYLEVGVSGSNNTLNINQKDTSKTAFVSAAGNYNSATVLQQGTGNHYLQLDLIGNGHTAQVTQDGAGSHNATVALTNGGGAWNFSLTQNSATAQTYSLPHTMSDNSIVSGTCNVAAGCNLTVNQQ